MPTLVFPAPGFTTSTSFVNSFTESVRIISPGKIKSEFNPRSFAATTASVTVQKINARSVVKGGNNYTVTATVTTATTFSSVGLTVVGSTINTSTAVSNYLYDQNTLVSYSIQRSLITFYIDVNYNTNGPAPTLVNITNTNSNYSTVTSVVSYTEKTVTIANPGGVLPSVSGMQLYLGYRVSLTSYLNSTPQVSKYQVPYNKTSVFSTTGTFKVNTNAKLRAIPNDAIVFDPNQLQKQIEIVRDTPPTFTTGKLPPPRITTTEVFYTPLSYKLNTNAKLRAIPNEAVVFDPNQLQKQIEVVRADTRFNYLSTATGKLKSSFVLRDTRPTFTTGKLPPPRITTTEVFYTPLSYKLNTNAKLKAIGIIASSVTITTTTATVYSDIQIPVVGKSGISSNAISWYLNDNNILTVTPQAPVYVALYLGVSVSPAGWGSGTTINVVNTNNGYNRNFPITTLTADTVYILDPGDLPSVSGMTVAFGRVVGTSVPKFSDSNTIPQINKYKITSVGTQIFYTSSTYKILTVAKLRAIPNEAVVFDPNQLQKQIEVVRADTRFNYLSTITQLQKQIEVVRADTRFNYLSTGTGKLKDSFVLKADRSTFTTGKLPPPRITTTEVFYTPLNYKLNTNAKLRAMPNDAIVFDPNQLQKPIEVVRGDRRVNYLSTITQLQKQIEIVRDTPPTFTTGKLPPPRITATEVFYTPLNYKLNTDFNLKSIPNEAVVFDPNQLQKQIEVVRADTRFNYLSTATGKLKSSFVLKADRSTFTTGKLPPPRITATEVFYTPLNYKLNTDFKLKSIPNEAVVFDPNQLQKPIEVVRGTPPTFTTGKLPPPRITTTEVFYTPLNYKLNTDFKLKSIPNESTVNKLNTTAKLRAIPNDAIVFDSTQLQKQIEVVRADRTISSITTSTITVINKFTVPATNTQVFYNTINYKLNTNAKLRAIPNDAIVFDPNQLQKQIEVVRSITAILTATQLQKQIEIVRDTPPTFTTGKLPPPRITATEVFYTPLNYKLNSATKLRAMPNDAIVFDTIVIKDIVVLKADRSTFTTGKLPPPRITATEVFYTPLNYKLNTDFKLKSIPNDAIVFDPNQLQKPIEVVRADRTIAKSTATITTSSSIIFTAPISVVAKTGSTSTAVLYYLNDQNQLNIVTTGTGLTTLYFGAPVGPAGWGSGPLINISNPNTGYNKIVGVVSYTSDSVTIVDIDGLPSVSGMTAAWGTYYISSTIKWSDVGLVPPRIEKTKLPATEVFYTPLNYKLNTDFNLKSIPNDAIVFDTNQLQKQIEVVRSATRYLSTVTQLQKQIEIVRDNNRNVFGTDLISKVKVPATNTKVFYSPLNYKLNSATKLRAIPNDAIVFDPNQLQKQIEVVRNATQVNYLSASSKLTTDFNLKSIPNEAIVFDPNIINRTKISSKNTQVFYNTDSYKLNTDFKLKSIPNEAIVFDPNIINRTKISSKNTQVFYSPSLTQLQKQIEIVRAMSNEATVFDAIKLNTAAKLRAMPNDAIVFDPGQLRKQLEIIKETAPIRSVNKLLSAEKVCGAGPVLLVSKLVSAVKIKEPGNRLSVNKLISINVLRNVVVSITTDEFNRTKILRADQSEVLYVADSGQIIRLKTGNTALGQTGISDVSAVKKEPIQFWN